MSVTSNTPKSRRHILAFMAAFGCFFSLSRPSSANEAIFFEDFEEGFAKWADTGGSFVAVKEADYAHSGEKMIGGSATALSEPMVFKFSANVEREVVYEFALWATSKNGCVLTLNMDLSDGSRSTLGYLTGIERSWVKRSLLVQPGVDGRANFELLMPDTSVGPPGKVFLDDVQLRKVSRTPGVLSLSTGNAHGDYPAMANIGVGSQVVAWVEFDGRRESVNAVRVDGMDVVERVRVSESNMGVMGPAIAANGSNILIVWPELRDGNWDIVGKRCDGRLAEGERFTVSSSPEADWNQACASDSSRKFQVVWQRETNDGPVIMSRAFSSGEWSREEQISSAGVPSRNPAIAIDTAGKTLVAWEAFVDSDYDIMLFKPEEGGRWFTVGEKTVDDTRPSLSASDEGVWVAWNKSGIIPEREISKTRGKRHAQVTRRINRKVVLGLFSSGKLRMTDGIGPKPAMTAGEELVVPISLRAGVALASVAGRLGEGHWDLLLRAFDFDGWGETVMPGGVRYGPPRKPAMARDGDALYLAWTSDNRYYQRRTNSKLRDIGNTTVVLTAQKIEGQETGKDKLSLGEGVALHPFSAVKGKNRSKHDHIRVDEEKFNVYWGDLNLRSSLSLDTVLNDAHPADIYAIASDYSKCDFMALTDDSRHMNAADWRLVEKLSSIHNRPGRFIAFPGYHWTSRGVDNAGYGRKNVILRDNFSGEPVDGSANMTPEELWKSLPTDAAITIPVRLADRAPRVATDWSFRNDALQPVAEIHQTRGAYEYRGCPGAAQGMLPNIGHTFQDALASGHVIGAAAGSGHGGGNGKLAVFARSLTREDIFEAILNRRTYATTEARIFLDFRVNGKLMGSVLTERAPDMTRTVKLEVRGTAGIRDTVIFKNNVPWKMFESEGKIISRELTDTKPGDGTDIYYVRVIQRDGSIAWSSPIWVTGETQAAKHSLRPSR
ncbi:DUF3604 domain-containing protein [Candidatus Hydrogenedentota bacterium]